MFFEVCHQAYSSPPSWWRKQQPQPLAVELPRVEVAAQLVEPQRGAATLGLAAQLRVQERACQLLPTQRKERTREAHSLMRRLVLFSSMAK